MSLKWWIYNDIVIESPDLFLFKDVGQISVNSSEKYEVKLIYR